MHREIKIKQFPIVITHWWPKTRNERFVWENEQYLYRFYLLYTTMSKWSECRTHPVCDVCVCAGSGSSASTLDGGRVWSVVLTRRHSYNNQSHTSLVLHDWIGYLHEAIWLADASIGAWKVASAPRFRHALRQAWARARTHTRHTPDVCALRSLGHGCVQEVKNYKYCSFSHTNRSFRVLGHQCVVTMGKCLILISLCMFFFPLIETDTYTCHYMTDRLERFDLKTSKLDLLKKKRHLHLGCPWGKLIDTKF